MQKNIYILIFFAWLGSTLLFAQSGSLYTDEDVCIFKRYLSYIESYKLDSDTVLLEKTARFFLGSPYEAHTLEITDTETTVVNLRKFDCATFVETVIALANTVKSGKPAFCVFQDELRKIRYRDGIVSDYASRLHYTSDWVHENERKGVMKNVSETLGGIRESQTVNFMSTHREAYKQIKTDDEMLGKIVAMENGINRRGGFYYLPKVKIAAAADKIPHMAMIGFVTGIKGLDTTHMGFAFRENGRLTFIHASTTQNKVVIDDKTLNDYCAAQKSCRGVMVVKVR